MADRVLAQLIIFCPFLDDDPDSVTSIWVDEDESTRKCHVKFFGGLNGLITRAWVNVNDTEPFDKNETLKKAGKFNFDDNVTKENFQCAVKEAKIGKEHALKKYEQFIQILAAFALYNFHNFGIIFAGQCTVCLKG